MSSICSHHRNDSPRSFHSHHPNIPGSSSTPHSLGLKFLSVPPPQMERNYNELEEILLTAHGNIVDNLSIEENKYVQFTPEEMDEKRLIVHDDKLCIGKDNALLTTINEAGIMVVLFDDGEIYAAYAIAGSVFHSSLNFPNKKRIAVGNIKAALGELTYADDYSGHFAPHPDSIKYLISELIHHRRASYAKYNFAIKPSKFHEIPNEQRISPDLRAIKINELARRHSFDLSASDQSSSSSSTALIPHSNLPSLLSGSQRARILSEELLHLSISLNTSPSVSPIQSPSLLNREILTLLVESNK